MSEARENLRRNPREMLTVYRLNPGFRDIIVEGRNDAKWFRWLCGELGIDDVKVFAVDDRVSIDGETNLNYYPEVNCRGRAISFAAIMSESEIDERQVTVIIDSDFDIIDEARGMRPTRSSMVLSTDYPSLEGYALLNRPFKKFLINIVDTTLSPEATLHDILPILATIFAVRFVVHRMGFDTSLPKRPVDAATARGGVLVMTPRDLLLRCSPSLKKDDIERAESAATELLDSFPNDFGIDYVHGHDIAPVAARYFNLKNDASRSEVIETQLMQSIELVDVMDQRLIKHLVKRLSKAD